MSTFLLRTLPLPATAAVAALLFSTSSPAQNVPTGWDTRVDLLDDLPTNLLDLRSLEIGDLHGEGTRDMVLRTSQGTIYGYGVGRYAHHAAIADLGLTNDLTIVGNGPGVPDIVVTTESNVVQRWQGDAVGLTTMPVFDSTDVTAGGRVTAFGQDQMMGLLTVVESPGPAQHQALSFLITQPSATRFGLDPFESYLGEVEVRQALFHDLLQVGVPLLLILQGSTVTAHDVLTIGSTPTEVPEPGPADGLLCPCPAEAGCHPLLWVGRSEDHWVRRRLIGMSLEEEVQIAPYDESMAPLRGVEFVDFGVGGGQLCVTFDDRILLTSVEEDGPDDLWLIPGDVSLPGGFSNSSPAAFDDVDGDGDLDILVAYGNAQGDVREGIPGEFAALVWHENEAVDAATLLPELVPDVLFSWGRDDLEPGTLTMDIAAPDWTSVEVLVFDVPLGVGLSSPLPDTMPEFAAVAVAAGVATAPDPDSSKLSLELTIPPGVGRTIGGETRLALLELRGKDRGSSAVGTPQRGPSRFYIGALDGSRLLLPGDFGDGVGGRAVLGPPLRPPVRPQVIIPPVQIYRYRPPRRGARPNPTAAGQD